MVFHVVHCCSRMKKRESKVLFKQIFLKACLSVPAQRDTPNDFSVSQMLPARPSSVSSAKNCMQKHPFHTDDGMLPCNWSKMNEI